MHPTYFDHLTTFDVWCFTIIILVLWTTTQARWNFLMAQKAKPKHPTTCVAVFVLNDKNEVLIGLRTHNNTVKGVPEWALPGGKIDYFEDAKRAAFREVEEETGLQIGITRFVNYSDDMFYKDDNRRHYVTLYFQGFVHAGTLTVMEPDKLSEWKWVPIEECPELFVNSDKQLRNLVLPTKVTA